MHLRSRIVQQGHAQQPRARDVGGCEAGSLRAAHKARKGRIPIDAREEDRDEKGLREPRVGARAFVSETGPRMQARIPQATEANAARHSHRLLGSNRGPTKGHAPFTLLVLDEAAQAARKLEISAARSSIDPRP